jgi:hypothetical protein
VTVSNQVAANARPVRGTQLLVEHMGQVFKRPVLTLIEIAWRWLVGIPALWVLWRQWEKILAAYPLDASGFNSIDTQNPWVAATQIGNVWAYYAPHVAPVLAWLVPVAAVAWVVVSGIGRNAILMRLEKGIRFRPLSMIALQGAWAALLALTLWGWFRSMHWVAAEHLQATREPDLIGFFIWAIFLSLGFFAGFALLSWPFAIAPHMMLLERRSALSSLGQAFRLGRGFTSKLVEINLVMGIVKLTLIVLAMVLASAPLPFSDELGSGALQWITAGAVVFYLVANDYFQVVRLKAFVGFWKVFRGGETAS